MAASRSHKHLLFRFNDIQMYAKFLHLGIREMHLNGVFYTGLKAFEIRSLSENVLIDTRSDQTSIVLFRNPEL